MGSFTSDTRGPPAPARAATRGVPRRLRDVVVGSVSVLVLIFLVFFALAGPSSELRASIGPVVPRPGKDAVVEGRVLEANGGGLEGARITVRSAGRRAAAALSNEAGAFRVELEGACASYSIALSADADGSDVRAGSTRRLCPGDALPVDARVVTSGHFLWVPGPR